MLAFNGRHVTATLLFGMEIGHTTKLNKWWH
jgi:hypothetical protein